MIAHLPHGPLALAIRIAPALAVLWLALSLPAQTIQGRMIDLPGEADSLLAVGPDRLVAASRRSGDLHLVDTARGKVETFRGAVPAFGSLLVDAETEGAVYAVPGEGGNGQITRVETAWGETSRTRIALPPDLADPAAAAAAGELLVWDRRASDKALLHRRLGTGSYEQMALPFPPRVLVGAGMAGTVLALDEARGRAAVIDVARGTTEDLIDFLPFAAGSEPAVFAPLARTGGSGDVLLADAQDGVLLLLSMESAKLRRLAAPLRVSFTHPGARGGEGRTLLAADGTLSVIMVGVADQSVVLVLARIRGGIEVVGLRRMPVAIRDMAVLHGAAAGSGDLFAILGRDGRRLVLLAADDLKDPVLYRDLGSALMAMRSAYGDAVVGSPRRAPAPEPPEDIAGLQRKLSDLGYDVGSVDGIMGPATAGALAAFQRAAGLSETGTPDLATLAALGAAGTLAAEPMALPGPPMMPAGQPAIPSAGTEARAEEVQRILAALGYQVGAIGETGDGFTRSAIRAFQFDRDLPVTGEIDAETRAALDAAVGMIREGGDAEATGEAGSFGAYLRQHLGGAGSRSLLAAERSGAGFDPDSLARLGDAHADPSHPCFGLNAPAPPGLWPNAVRLARIVQGLEQASGRAVEIESAYRTPAYNQCLGGPPTSPHLDFAAMILRPGAETDTDDLGAAVDDLVRRDGIAARTERAGAVLRVALSDPPVRRSTVYVQFAGMTPSDARDLALELAERGYDVPAGEAVPAAAGMWEIRYYHAGDRDSAEAVGAAVAEVMRDLALADRPPPRLADLTGFRGQKPDPGVIELWLGL